MAPDGQIPSGRATRLGAWPREERARAPRPPGEPKKCWARFSVHFLALVTRRAPEGNSVGSLLLGLYSDDGVFHHVGHTSSFKAAEKRELVEFLAPYISDDNVAGFGSGRTPGAPSRWTGDRDMTWVRLRPELVCEVTFDCLQGPRFRHAATFQRWRHDKPPTACTFDQIETVPPYELQQIFKK